MLYISEIASATISRAVLITGSARSGTTIMGKLIHSMEGVEYAFEPPMLFILFPLIQKIPKTQWNLLYETYLYEEFLINAISGRAINCNRADASSIYEVKDKAEIERRLSHSVSKPASEILAVEKTLAYKMPDITPFVPNLLVRYPGTRVLVMLRDALGTLNSIVQKGWFNNKNDKAAHIWPFRKCQSVHVPFWVREDDERLWAELSEIDRAAYYYIRINESIEEIQDRIEIKYSCLLSNPLGIAEMLAEKLDLKFGAKTKSIIKEILPTHPPRDKDIMERIRPDIRKKVEFYSSKSI